MVKILYTPEYELKQELLARLKKVPPEHMNVFSKIVEALVALKDATNILFIEDCKELKQVLEREE